MNKIICSSRAMASLLEKFLVNVPSWEQDDETAFVISTKGNKLRLGDFTLDIESRLDWQFDFYYSTIKKMKKLFKKIPEQPVIVEFSDNRIELTKILV